MRILVASPYLPWPVNSGGNAVQFSTLKCLAQDHDFTLVCPVYDAAGVEHARELQSHLDRVKIRAVFCGKMAPARRSARQLLMAVIQRAVHGGKRLLAPPPKPQAIRPYNPFYPLPEPLIDALSEEFSRGVDIFQAEFAEMLSLGGWIPRETPSVFIHHQVHFVYAQRCIDVKGKDQYAEYVSKLMFAQEITALKHYKAIITFSDEDRKAIIPFISPEAVFTSPFPIPADVGIAEDLPPEFKGKFMFVASEAHAPNRDALRWMIEAIWPKIRAQLPQTSLVVIGRWSKSAMKDFAAPGVQFSGFVDDLPSFLRGGIMLVPLRIGSGLRVKIISALAQGVPVVSTSIGAEGIPVQDGRELLVRDRPNEFAAAAIDVARDPNLWRLLTNAGRDAIARDFSPERVRARRNQIYDALIRRR